MKTVKEEEVQRSVAQLDVEDHVDSDSISQGRSDVWRTGRGVLSTLHVPGDYLD